MRSLLLVMVLWAVLFLDGVHNLAPTDEYRDADQQQSGYLPNHNLDPAIVNSPAFGQLWRVTFNAGEQVSLTPLFLSINLDG